MRAAQITILACALALTGCGTPPRVSVVQPGLSPRQAFFQQYMGALTVSNAVYEETLRAVGRAKARGLVTEHQEQAAIHAGRLANLAIGAARDALLIYLTATDSDLSGQASVLDAIAEMNHAIAILTQIIEDMGKLGENDERIMAQPANWQRQPSPMVIQPEALR